MDWETQKNIVGLDETGVGDYFTTLVCVATYVSPQNLQDLLPYKNVIKDSKKMSDKKIIEVARLVKPLVRYSIKHLTPKGYNTLNRSFNAHEIKTLLHFQALEWLLSERLESVDKIERIVLDAYASPKKMATYLENLENSWVKLPKVRVKYDLVEKAEDAFLAVAISSIIARDFMLTKLREQSEKWKMRFPLGASAKVILFAQEFVQMHGKENLPEVAKINFKTTQAVLATN